MTTTEATDFDIARLRARRTNKWHKFPPDVLPAWVADMDFGVAPSITAALARLMRNQEYGYAARDGVLAAAFVRRMERRFGWHTDPADTIAIGDLVQASRISRWVDRMAAADLTESRCASERGLAMGGGRPAESRFTVGGSGKSVARWHRTVLAYWKFESISLQRRVVQNFISPHGD